MNNFLFTTPLTVYIIRITIIYVNKIKKEHLDQANDKTERDKILEIIESEPKQFQIVLYTIMSLLEQSNDPIFTGDIYETYKNNCNNCSIKPLTQRRISDIIAELDMLGIINAKVISKGRYGRTREISLAIPGTNMPKLKDVLNDFNY